MLKGAIAGDVAFISGPFEVPTTQPAIYFLRPDGARYRVLEHDSTLGVDRTLEPAIIAEAGFTARAEWAKQLDVVKADIAVFRSMAGKPWSPDQRQAIAAARKIFATVPMIGIPASEIERTLGKPDEVMTDGRWRYVRHDGEAGAMYALRIAGDRVSVVEIQRTQ